MPFGDEAPDEYDVPIDPTHMPSMSSFPGAVMTPYPPEMTSHQIRPQEMLPHPTTYPGMTSYPVRYHGMMSLPVYTYAEVKDARPLFYSDDLSRPQALPIPTRISATPRKYSTLASNPLTVHIPSHAPSEAQSLHHVNPAPTPRQVPDTPASRLAPATPILAPVAGYYPAPNQKMVMVKQSHSADQEKSPRDSSSCSRCPCIAFIMLGLAAFMVAAIVAIVVLIKCKNMLFYKKIMEVNLTPFAYSKMYIPLC